LSAIPYINEGKQYWLIRTNGGKYYRYYRSGGYIAINWDLISFDEINELSVDDLSLRVKRDYPEAQRPGRAANQLKIFTNQIKAGDTVLITGPSSHLISIGEVEDTIPYTAQPTLNEDGEIVGCPYIKRKRVRWLHEVEKLDLGKKLIKFVQRAEHTISEANDYADEIEGLYHSFFINGDRAQLILEVEKEEAIPAAAFFELGHEIFQLAREFNEYSNGFKIDIAELATQININSRGKFKLAGIATSVIAIALLFEGLTGGKSHIKFPIVGGGIDLEVGSIIRDISDFLDRREERKEKSLIMQKYIEQLEVKSPEELKALLQATETENKDNENEGTTSAER